MMNEQDKLLIHELVLKSLEEVISAEEAALLESLVLRDLQTRQYYQKCIRINCDISRISDVVADSFEKTMMLHEMAQ